MAHFYIQNPYVQYMPKVTQEYKEKVRKKITHSAIKIFAKYGYAKTTTDDLADAARISVGTLYLYFPSKEDLFYSICAELDKTIVEKNRKVVFTASRLESELEELYDGLTENNKHFDKILIDALNESKNNPKLRKIWINERNTAVDILESFLKNIKDNGPFLQNIQNLKPIASGFIALYDGLSMARQAGDVNEDNKKAFVKTMKLILNSK